MKLQYSDTNSKAKHGNTAYKYAIKGMDIVLKRNWTFHNHRKQSAMQKKLFRRNQMLLD